jgi:hypothetical protein
MPSPEGAGRQIAVHGACCAERWKQTNSRLSRIERILGLIVFLIVGEGSVIDLLEPVLGG